MGEDEADDDYRAVQEDATIEDLSWNRLCKDRAATLPNIFVQELELLRKNSTRHKDMEAVHMLHIQAHEKQNYKTIPDTS